MNSNSIVQVIIIGLVSFNFCFILNVDCWHIKNDDTDVGWYDRIDGSTLSPLEYGHNNKSQIRVKRQADIKLAFSTLIAIRSFSLQGFEPNTFKDGNKINLVHSESKYIIKSFDLSFIDNLVVFGITNIFASNIRGESNYLSIYQRTDLNIKFESEFVIDWKDHNVYVYNNKQILIYLFRQNTYHNIIYNASQSVRNLMVDSFCDLICWIDNGNSIMKAKKDGKDLVTARTEKGIIHAMASDSSTLRFFYITTKMTTEEKRVDKNTVIVKHYHGLIYSVDHEGQFEPEMEGSFKMAGAESNVTYLVKHFDSLFFVIADLSNSGDTVYSLCHLSLVDKAKDHSVLYQSVNFEITAMRIVDNNFEKSDLCEKARCQHMCIHVDKKTVRCVCRLGTSSCDPNPQKTTKKTGVTTQQAKPQTHQDYTFSIILYSLVVICLLLLVYLAYVYFCDKEVNDEEEEDEQNVGVKSSDEDIANTPASDAALRSGSSPISGTFKSQISGVSKSNKINSNLSTASLNSTPVKSSLINNAILSEVKGRGADKKLKAKKDEMKKDAAKKDEMKKDEAKKDAAKKDAAKKDTAKKDTAKKDAAKKKKKDLNEPSLKKIKSNLSKSSLVKSNLGLEENGSQLSSESPRDIVDGIFDWFAGVGAWFSKLFKKGFPFLKSDDKEASLDVTPGSNLSELEKGKLDKKQNDKKKTLKQRKAFQKKDKSNGSEKKTKKIDNYVIDRKKAIVLDDNPDSFIPIDLTEHTIRHKKKSKAKSHSKERHRKSKSKLDQLKESTTFIINEYSEVGRKKAIILNSTPNSFSPIDPFKDSSTTFETSLSSTKSLVTKTLPDVTKSDTRKTPSASPKRLTSKTISGSTKPRTKKVSSDSPKHLVTKTLPDVTKSDTRKTPSASPKRLTSKTNSGSTKPRTKKVSSDSPKHLVTKTLPDVTKSDTRKTPSASPKRLTSKTNSGSTKPRTQKVPSDSPKRIISKTMSSSNKPRIRRSRSRSKVKPRSKIDTKSAVNIEKDKLEQSLGDKKQHPDLTTKTTTSEFISLPSQVNAINVGTEPFDTSPSSDINTDKTTLTSKEELVIHGKNSDSQKKKKEQKYDASHLKSSSKQKQQDSSAKDSKVSLSSIDTADPTLRSGSSGAR